MSVRVINTVTSCPAPLVGGLEDCHVQKLFRELSALVVIESPACGRERGRETRGDFLEAKRMRHI